MDIEELKRRLSISIDFEEAGRAYYDGDHRLTIQLKLDSEVISEASTSLPNRERESPY